MDSLISEYSKLIQEMCAITLMVIVLLFNLPVIVSSGLILSSKVQPWTTHMFLGNLALADLLHGIVCVFITQLLPNIENERVACLLVLGLANSYAIECSLSVCLIAFDRYIYIRHGLHYSRWITTKRVRYTLAATWTFSLTIGLVTELNFGNNVNDGCSYFGVTPFFGLLLIGFLGLIPNLITVFLYILIFITAFKVGKTKCKKYLRKLNYDGYNLNNLALNDSLNNLRRTDDEIIFSKINETIYKTESKGTNEKSLFSIDSKQRDRDNVSSDEYDEYIKHTKHTEKIISYTTDSNNKQEQQQINEHETNEIDKIAFKKCNCKVKAKSLKVVFLVMSNFTVSWGPCFVCLILYALLCNSTMESDVCASLESILGMFTLCLGLFNAILNPLIYCWWYKAFRKSFLKIFCKHKIREKRRRDFIVALWKQKISEKDINLDCR